MTEKGSGITITAGGIGTAAAIYVARACIGALFFGHCTAGNFRIAGRSCVGA